MTLFSACKKLLQRYLSEDRGSVVVLTAVMAPVIIGGIGLGVETGHWYQKQRHLQHLADVASYSGASQLRSGGDLAAITASATTVADVSGYDTEIGEIQVYSPPISGEFAGDDTAVEVVITEHRKRWFSAIYQSGNVEVTGRAVSKVEGGSHVCLLALSSYGYRSLEVINAADVDLHGCHAAANSSNTYAFKVLNASHMNADCVHTVGGYWLNATLNMSQCDEVNTGIAPIEDPYATVPEPQVHGWCKYNRVGRRNRTTVVTPTDWHPSGMKSRRYCGGLRLKGTVYLESGLYIIDGGTLQISSNTKVYSKEGGVTFYLLNGATIQISGASDINLKAPNSGATSGILFFGSRSTGTGGSGRCSRAYGTEHYIYGGADVKLQGAVYLPTGDLNLSCSSETEFGCTQIIANTISVRYRAMLSANCESAGTKDIVVSNLVKLVE